MSLQHINILRVRISNCFRNGDVQGRCVYRDVLCGSCIMQWKISRPLCLLSVIRGSGEATQEDGECERKKICFDDQVEAQSSLET